MSNPLKKTMVYLGLADEEYEAETPQAPAQPQVPQPLTPTRAAAPVTPLPRKHIQAAASQPHLNEILTVHPRQYKDAQLIAESFRDGIPVIINVAQMSDGDARRLVDFASGLSQGLYGKIERVADKVFVLSPAHIVVTGEQGNVSSEVDASFFHRA